MPTNKEMPVTRVKMSYKMLSCRKPVPVAPPSDIIQLTPIVQPIAMVPYSTQSQPMMMMNEPRKKQ